MSVMFRRPGRAALCRMCHEPIGKGEIAISFWERAGSLTGWRYAHIHCALELSQNKEECNKTQEPVTVKEVFKAMRKAMTQVAIHRFTRGQNHDEDD